MKKLRFGAALTAAALSLTLILPAAAARAPEHQVVQTVNALGIMLGDEKGDMHLDDPVTRAEFVTMAVKAAPGGDQVGQTALSPYPDVPYSHWAAGFVKAAVDRNLVAGFTDGTFRPNQGIVLAEGFTIVLKLLGYTPADFAGGYPAAQMNLGRSLGLDESLLASRAGDPLTRRDSMYLFYNLMTTESKTTGVPYLTTLGHRLNSQGEIDLVALIHDSMEGPLTAREGWQSRLPFPADTARVIRNGSPVPLSHIQPLDVVYYSKSMRTVWAYSDKVTGSIQSLSPNGSQPTAVTVAGRTCPIESSAAAYELSELGSFRVGDSVTLLLGRDGGVADVVTPDQVQMDQAGLVTAVTDQPYSDGMGGTYKARTATLLTTDGSVYHYPCSDSVEAGDFLRATLSGDGSMLLSQLPYSSAEGRFSADGSRLGDTPLAADAEILDVSDTQGLRVYPARLAGVQLSSGDVRFCSRNSAGEIDRLILKDVTGDLWSYGILTDSTRSGLGEFNVIYSYSFDLGGTSVTAPLSRIGFPAGQGPVRILGSAADPRQVYQLNSVGSGLVTGLCFTSDRGSLPLDDGYLVYEKQGEEYRSSTLARVQSLGLTLTGYADKAADRGGRVRILVAQ